MSSSPEISLTRKYLFWVILVALLAALAYTVSSVQFPGRAITDVDNVAIMVAKDLNPDLFSSDYVFADDRFFRFYIPWYRWLLGRLWVLVGSVEMGMVWLVPVMVTIYVVGMTLLFTRLSGWVWVALGLALASTAYRETMGSEMWGVAGAHGMVARTIYTAVAPYLFWLVFRWLSSPSLKLSVIAGACLGLAANLHPTSGLFMVGFAAGLFVLTHFQSFRNWRYLATLLGVTLVGALPILLGVLGNTGQLVSADVSFETFSQIVIERIKIPFRPHDFEFDLIGVVLARPLLDYLVWFYLAASLGLAALFFVARRRVAKRARLIWLVGGLVVLFYAWMVALFNAPFFFVIAGLYIVYRFYRGPTEAVDWWSLGLMALVVLFSYVGYFVMAWVWQTFEVWSLTSLLIEQSRAARYVYVPVFFLSARAAAAWIPELQARVDWQRGLLYWRGVTPEAPSCPLSGSSLALVFGLLFAVESGISRRVFDTVFGIFVGVWGLTAAVILLAIALNAWKRSASRAWQVGGALAGLALIFFTPLGGWVADYSPVPVPVLNPTAQAEEVDGGQELYTWAQTNTSSDALFYWCGIDDRAALHFRAKVQRSITHNYKDLGLAIYDRAHLVEFYERYYRLKDACQTPATATAMAAELQADYILAPVGLPDPGLPLCFSGGGYAVYAVGQDCAAH